MFSDNSSEKSGVSYSDDNHLHKGTVQWVIFYKYFLAKFVTIKKF